MTGERHATTLEQAQKEVLICLGNMLWNRLQQLWLVNSAALDFLLSGLVKR